MKLSYIISIMLAAALMTELSSAQTLSTSTGRTNGITIEYNNNNYDSLKKMRSLIIEGEYDNAANRAIKFIRNNEGNERNGVEKTVYLKEAYNILCVASTSLGKLEYAMDACNRSLQLSPNHWESLKNRGVIHYLKNDYDKALADLKLAHQNSPSDKIREGLAQNVSLVESKLN
ncbi:tetratricopeptide repeat protein [Pseudemcibacter aquimaris]|uniref:tetratricopeptide repeat protein n=1 Tax=Pseudemcibacter aquimaris TaxID=2857064 RepID=UPI0020131389|nr:tetratricopeptide repeat protein [Pseudemcibacter aquimaris]MCC3862148.1 hypothetical protein [Pseudemcibacter aquimaris]WDU58901.1 hypothetical protein KW060_01260 [Pseudemcibacter aquimaris]